MNMQERMEQGMLYDPGEASIAAEQRTYLELLYDYNMTRPSQQQERTELLTKMFASIGERCYIEPPFRANWGGHHVYMGSDVYANFNLTLVDDTDIIIGDHVMFGPNVVIATAGHPILPSLREQALQFNQSVQIGNNVWLGAGTIVVPGVTIGDNSVIGAGSVVTKDIPANVVAVGSPCRVLRTIGERDRQYYYRDLEIDQEFRK